MLHGVNWKDVLERVEWTAAQAFLGTVAVGASGLNVSTAKAGVIAAAAAVLSLLKNIVKQNTPAGGQ
jgi:hypothetical protein